MKVVEVSQNATLKVVIHKEFHAGGKLQSICVCIASAYTTPAQVYAHNVHLCVFIVFVDWCRLARQLHSTGSNVPACWYNSHGH